MLIKRANFFIKVVILALFASPTTLRVSSLGSMTSIAVSYGENGPAVCALNADGSHSVICLGADQSVVYGAPSRLPLIGLTAGDSFVCGLLLDSKKPYCWGSNFYVKMGVPQPMEEASSYSSISAGDHHLCGLRIPTKKGISIIDCWGYNMTASHEFQGTVSTITAGSVFNCGLFERKSLPFCFGDETGSNVISLIPRGLSFQSISAGGFHVCGVLENFQVFCWGGSIETNRDNVEMVPMSPMVAVVGGRFHACGIKKEDRGVLCWGLHLPNSVPPPKEARVYGMAAGDYFTCGVDDKSLSPLCWGNGGPWSLQMTVSPGVCTPQPCSDGFFEYNHVSLGDKFCKPAGTKACMPCSNSCPEETYQLASCNSTSDISCQFNCSSCVSPACFSFCHLESKANNHIFFALQLPIFVAEIVFGVVLVASVSLGACLYVRYKLGKCQCSGNQVKANRARSSSFRKESVKVRPETEELKIQSIRMFTYEELDKATGGFKEESQVGKGSFSCVFKGVLKDGTVVAVKRPIGVSSSDLKKNSKEFRTELDLLSRLNHAHLLNLLGYCEEGGERLLVYEFMAHGSLYQHLHGKDPNVKEQLDWVRRVTITVQAARGIEYLHGYACPPVIHRDIKSSNILIDEEHNARVSDFGLSLLGPTDSSSPLSELPAGTLGYLDPEYYRLHYLTTKSDVYSFGVLLLEILSGRKAIDMRFDEGNIVEWAVPLIKAGNISSILDPALNPPSDIEAVKKIAAIACKCVRMKGKDRPSMDKVTTALERALALLMGSPCNDQPILPTEVVLGSSRLNKKASSQRSSNQSVSENEMGELEDQRFEYRAPSWITFPSVTSSSQRRNSVSEADVADGKFPEGKNVGNASNVGDSLRCLEEEIGPASPQKDLFLQHNF